METRRTPAAAWKGDGRRRVVAYSLGDVTNSIDYDDANRDLRAVAHRLPGMLNPDHPDRLTEAARLTRRVRWRSHPY